MIYQAYIGGYVLLSVCAVVWASVQSEVYRFVEYIFNLNAHIIVIVL